jgi:hypothetical protein
MLPSQALTIFTASSFACHDLLNKVKDNKALIRRVLVNGKKMDRKFNPPLDLERFLSVGFV